jgi:hypothetical protein
MNANGTEGTTMHRIATQRLQNQQIEYPRLKSPVEVLSWLGAIQGQDYPGAKWSLGLRVPGSTDAQIETLIAEKQIVRTWLMRGTLFLVTGADIRWMLELLAPRNIAGTTRRYRELELDEKTLSHSNDILVKALEGHKQLNRRQLLAILEEHGISTTGQRGIHLLQYASLNGLIFQSTVYNNNPLFMLLDEGLPDAKTLPRADALAELAKRYFTSRAPATLHDFAWWAGITMSDARAGLEAIKHDLVEEKIDGISYWLPANARYKSTPDSPCVYMPPGFDEYLLGYKERSAILAAQHAEKVCPGKNGVFFPTIVSDGQIIGIWKRTIAKQKITITTTPFERITDAEKEAFAAATVRFGEYHAMPVEIV